jgi:hypothetical protein
MSSECKQEIGTRTFLTLEREAAGFICEYVFGCHDLGDRLGIENALSIKWRHLPNSEFAYFARLDLL